MAVMAPSSQSRGTLPERNTLLNSLASTGDSSPPPALMSPAFSGPRQELEGLNFRRAWLTSSAVQSMSRLVSGRGEAGVGEGGAEASRRAGSWTVGEGRAGAGVVAGWLVAASLRCARCELGLKTRFCCRSTKCRSNVPALRGLSGAAVFHFLKKARAFTRCSWNRAVPLRRRQAAFLRSSSRR